jgi:hypothetical protein
MLIKTQAIVIKRMPKLFTGCAQAWLNSNKGTILRGNRISQQREADVFPDWEALSRELLEAVWSHFIAPPANPN